MFAMRASTSQSSDVRAHFRGRSLAFVFVALAVLITPALLFAHARLLRSSPAASSRLDASPAAVTLWFSERPEVRFTTISLARLGRNRGAARSRERLHRGQDGRDGAVSAPLANGTYSVVWRTAASDGHATNGRFTFSVRLLRLRRRSHAPNPPASVGATQTQPAARNPSNAPITSSEHAAPLTRFAGRSSSP